MADEISDKVAICAMATKGQPPRSVLDDYDTIICINNTHAVLHSYVEDGELKPDLIVAMDDLQRDVKLEPKYVNAIVNAGCPVLSTRRFKKWPSVQPYPLKEVIAYLNTPFPASKLLDNSICYATALAMARGAKTIGLFGVDLTPGYQEVDLECATVRWRHKGYGHAPDWFRYYDRFVLAYRAPQECGWESLHFLIGMGMAKGITFNWASDSSILNTDRDDFYYGFAKQPKGATNDN